MSLNLLAKKLAYYAYKHLGIDELDMIYLENILLGEFGISTPSKEEFDKEEIDNMLVPDKLIEELNSLTNYENKTIFSTKIMGLLTPSPSSINNKFWELRKKGLNKESLEFLYNLSIKNNYIQKTAIDRNIKWKYEIDKSFIEITINLSKPEKNNKDIAKALLQPQTEKYPKCLLCKENLGFYGTNTHPSRQNIRIIPLKLNNEAFFMQYSPYSYYPHHVIIINDEHTPMSICRETFIRHADFVDTIPEYFIGSNADLPIVGGSILSHEHYQGGGYLMPLMYSKDRFIIKTSNPELKLSYLDWFNSCICIKTKNKELLIDSLDKLRIKWSSYDDLECDIISHTNNIRHNTITPILRKVNDEYIAYVILRNNRTNEKYPDGIFHAHPEYHNIKSEGIGLIEAMGLFILPGRLDRQCKEMERILSQKIDLTSYFDENPDMLIHKNMIEYLMKQNSNNYQLMIKEYINEVCMHILENTAVFKNTEIGNNHAKKFIESINL